MSKKEKIKRSPRITVAVPEETLEMWRKFCDQTGNNLSATIRQAMGTFIKNNGGVKNE
jgi:hypothetical protein